MILQTSQIVGVFVVEGTCAGDCRECRRNMGTSAVYGHGIVGGAWAGGSGMGSVGSVGGGQHGRGHGQRGQRGRGAARAGGSAQARGTM